MRADIYWIDAPNVPARIGIGPRPRGGDWLGDEVRAWRTAGVNVVVSLLTPEEVAELEIGDEGAECLRAGIEFVQLAIPDRGLPASRGTLEALVATLKRALADGRQVFVHCRQGIGRSTMLAARILSAFGMAPHKALEAIETARGRPVPDTPEQRAWILSE